MTEPLTRDQMLEMAREVDPPAYACGGDTTIRRALAMILRWQARGPDSDSVVVGPTHPTMSPGRINKTTVRERAILKIKERT